MIILNPLNDGLNKYRIRPEETWRRELANIPLSQGCSIVFPWDEQLLQFSMVNWDENKVMGAVTQDDILGLFEKLKKCPSYGADLSTSRPPPLPCYVWFLLLLPIFGWALLILILMLRCDERKLRLNYMRRMQLRKYEFDLVLLPWNELRKNNDSVQIFAGGSAGSHLTMYIMKKIKAMTLLQMKKQDVPWNLHKYSLDSQAIDIADIQNQQILQNMIQNSQGQRHQQAQKFYGQEEIEMEHEMFNLNSRNGLNQTFNVSPYYGISNQNNPLAPQQYPGQGYHPQQVQILTQQIGEALPVQQSQRQDFKVIEVPRGNQGLI